MSSEMPRYLDANAKPAHRFSYNVYRTRHHNHPVGTSQNTCLIEGAGNVRSLFDFGPGADSRFANFSRSRRSRIVGVGCDHSLGHGKQDLRDFTDRLVAHGYGGREIGVGSRVNAAVYPICIEDPPIDAVQPAEIENLRYGLNAVARYLR